MFRGAGMNVRFRFVVTAGCLALAVGSAVRGASAQDSLEDRLYPAETKPRRWTDAWYDHEAQSPVGGRQKKHKGKLWPPYPRPTGPEQQFSHKFHAAHYWPFPYVCDDRMYVRELSARQVDGGWMTATTLYDYHFDPETHEVNSAGRLHLKWILEGAPISRRMIHVQSTLAADSSEARMASVRQELVYMMGPETAPPVMLRITSAYGRPASEIDLIRRAELGSIPAPRIQYTPAGGSGSSGSGGGGDSGM